MGETMTTFAERAARFDDYAAKGWLVQGDWRSEKDGHEIACALGAMYGVTSVDACPADDMPVWLKHLVVTLFDGLPFDEAVPGIAAINSEVLRIGANAEAWARIETRFKIACVRRAIAAAEPVAKDTAYWPAVTQAAQQVCDALEGRGDLAAANAAAKAAAEAAAWAVAARAAAAAAAEGAWVAARAAEAAAWAAEAARAAAWAAAEAVAWAARAAARAAAKAAAKAAIYRDLHADLLTAMRAEPTNG